MFKRKVGELARRPGLLPATATAHEAAAVLVGQDATCLAAVAGRKVVGFVTERELCRHLDVDLEPETPIGEILMRTVAAVPENMIVEEAVKHLLEGRTRHLVVTRLDGTMLGLVTDKEFVDALAVDFMVDNVTCREVVRPDTVTADPEASVREVLRLLRERDVGSVVLTAEGKPVGIFTERDALAKILGTPGRLAEPVHRFMSRPVIGVPLSAMIYKVILFMRQRQVRRVAVMREPGATLAGILTQRHILLYSRRLD